MTDLEWTIVSNPALSTDARIVAMALLRKGEGFHEMPRDEVRDLLSSDAGRDRAQRAIKQLERHDVIERRAGGRGHHDQFAVKLPGNPVANTDIYLPDNPAANDKRPSSTVSIPFSGRNSRTLNSTVVEEEDVRRTEPPVVPLAELDERTADVVDRLIGCRGAVRDYLMANVPNPNRRYAYAQTVASWLDGADVSVWRLPGGGALPPEERPGMLAAALNELAAGEEADMKRRVGDPANLRTKLNVNLKRRMDHERNSNGSGAHRGRTAGAVTTEARDSGDYDHLG